MPAPSTSPDLSRRFPARWLRHLALCLMVCTGVPGAASASMDDVAERWVKVALSMNEHDAG